jgi:Glycosyl hydrolases family 16
MVAPRKVALTVAALLALAVAPPIAGDASARAHHHHRRAVRPARVVPNVDTKLDEKSILDSLRELIAGLIPLPGILAPPANPAADPSGEAAPSGDLPGWHQIFMDNFATAVPRGSFPRSVSSRWGAYADGWHDSSGYGTYSCSKVCSVQNGVLNLYLHSENGVPLVAAPYPLIPGGSSHNGQLYGRYAVRFKSDPVAGYKTAWLLWPDSERWPRDGEIDFPEGSLNGTFCAFMHRQGATSSVDQDAYCTSASYTSWHTAVIEWSPLNVKFILDGRTIGTSTSRIPNTPMHWVLQTETNGARPSSNAAGNVQIDWVAVYRPG